MKKFILIFCLPIALLAGCGKSPETYNAELRNTADSISQYYQQMEYMYNTYVNTWATAISNDRDFNEALASQRKVFEVITPVMEQRKAYVDSCMKAHTAEIPDDSKGNYEKVLAFYNSYAEAYDAATDPSGSLTTYRAKTIELDDARKKHENVLKIAGLISTPKPE